MRNLSRIIFINSANIPYQEVSVDGNVHFGGDNGVGKTTVLRAILFFYNADRNRLGIDKNKSPFDDFYLPNTNSYIIYEVAVDKSAYFVIVYRHNGKIAFRFVDTPYNRSYFVDSNGLVYSDFNKIRTIIGADIDVSNILDKSAYRNILFGNLGNEGRKYLKYSITRSPRYENITKSIQNVYLNSKLDADFMKDMIIQSLPDYDYCLSLDQIRSHLDDYHQEVMDVQLWFKKESNGEIKQRKKAEDVISAYREYLAADKNFVDTWHSLKYAARQSKARIPLIERDIEDISKSIDRLNLKISGLESEFKSRHESLLGKISQLNGKLSDIRQRKKYYKDIDIQSMIALDGQENKCKEELESKKLVLDSILDQEKNIRDYYKSIYDALDLEMKNFSLSLDIELSIFKESLQYERDNAQNKYETQRENAETAHREFMLKSDEIVNNLNSILNEIDNNRIQISIWHPKGQEIKSVKEQLTKIAEQEKKCRLKISTINEELSLMQREAESNLSNLEFTFSNKRDGIMKDIDDLKIQCSELESILSNLEGSLYQWLSDNKPDWEDNIGKVINESVLYSANLKPSLSTAESLYGIDIDLEALTPCVCKPDAYKLKLKTLKSEIESKKKTISDLTNQHNQDVDRLQKSFRTKANIKKDQLAIYEQFLQTSPQKTRDLKTTLFNLEKEEKSLIDERLGELETKRRSILSQINNEKSSRKQEDVNYEGIKQSHKKKYANIKSDIQNRLKIFSDNIEKQRLQKKFEIDSKRSDYEAKERNELSDKNVDVNSVEILRREIKEIQDILDKISNQKIHIFGYLKDKKELFDHEDELKESKQVFESKDLQLNRSFDSKKTKLTNELGDHNNSKSQLEKELDEIETALAGYHSILEIENLIPDNLMNDMIEHESASSFSVLISQMRRCNSYRNKVFSKLKGKKDEFFILDNGKTVNFKTLNILNPNSDNLKDILDFAKIVQEFMINDKISEFSERTSQHIEDIIKTISRQFGMIEDKKASVKSLVDKINQDFKKYNFAQVIRRIELKMEPESDDPVSSLLSDIHRFFIENPNFGQMNLFSDSDPDTGIVNQTAIKYLDTLKSELDGKRNRSRLTLSDTFRLLFQVEENDKCTAWLENLSQIGSDGTSILVKAMINIMLISIYKNDVSNKYGEFIVHCIMDEIGKISTENIYGLLNFANKRNIHIITGSPVQYNGSNFKYNYVLKKDRRAKTIFTKYLENHRS